MPWHGKKPMSLTVLEFFKQSMGARNRIGIGLSYRSARLHSLAESVPWNRFLGSLKFQNSGSQTVHLFLPLQDPPHSHLVISVFAYATCKYIVVELYTFTVVRMWIRPFLSIPKTCVMLRFVAVPTNTVL
jgi:hypothetical protein